MLAHPMGTVDSVHVLEWVAGRARPIYLTLATSADRINRRFAWSADVMSHL